MTFVDEDNLKRLLHVLDLLIQEGHTELQGHFWYDETIDSLPKLTSKIYIFEKLCRNPRTLRALVFQDEKIPFGVLR